jgi:hypothetical protein
MQYEVADSKGGKKGRCPTCGAAIHVPSLGEAGSAYHKPRSGKHLSHMAAWIGISVIAALLLLIVVLVSRESGTVETPRIPPPQRPAVSQRPSTPSPAQPAAPDRAVAKPRTALAPPAPTGEPTPSKSEENRAFLVRYAAEQLGEYRAALAQERRLSAREVLRKTRNNEPVEMEEYELQRQVMEEAAALTAQGQDTSKWRLNEPLSDPERKELADLTTRLQTTSNDLRQEFMRLGFRVGTHTDIYGRTLINVEEAEEKLDALMGKPPPS